MKNLGVILLAAGLGKRMKSTLPKVLHCLGGKPLLSYPLRTAKSLNPKKIAIVVGHGADAVRQVCDDNEVAWIFQERQLGTGHAVDCTKGIYQGFPGDLLILSGDVPLVSQQSLLELLRHHRKQKATVTLLTASLEEPFGYGRILRNEKEELTGIIEERDAAEPEKKIKEVNAGVYAVCPRFLFSSLEELTNHNEQGEYYLPDIVGLALKRGENVQTVQVEDAREILGINTREELAMMEKTLREKINRRWMEAGVTLIDPQATYIEEEVTIGRDTVIGPNTHLTGRTVIGEQCRIDGCAYITNALLGDEVHLKFSVVLTDCRIEDGAIVGPFAHLRPGTVLSRHDLGKQSPREA